MSTDKEWAEWLNKEHDTLYPTKKKPKPSLESQKVDAEEEISDITPTSIAEQVKRWHRPGMSSR